MADLNLPLKPLELALNRALALDPDAPRRLRPLVGRRLTIELSGLPSPVGVRFEERGLSLGTAAEDADAYLRTSPAALLGYALRRGAGGAEVDFRGDVAVVQAVRSLFTKLDVDLEEQLSRLTGDVVAHQLGNLARATFGWIGHLRSRFEQNLGEYLTEEADQLATRAEVDGFLVEVDRLRQAADRLEARLQRLERSRGPK